MHTSKACFAGTHCLPAVQLKMALCAALVHIGTAGKALRICWKKCLSVELLIRKCEHTWIDMWSCEEQRLRYNSSALRAWHAPKHGANIKELLRYLLIVQVQLSLVVTSGASRKCACSLTSGLAREHHTQYSMWKKEIA